MNYTKEQLAAAFTLWWKKLMINEWALSEQVAGILMCIVLVLGIVWMWNNPPNDRIVISTKDFSCTVTHSVPTVTLIGGIQITSSEQVCDKWERKY